MGRHVIAAEGFRHPQDNKDTFKVLGEEDILDSDSVATMAKMAGFRHLVVHEYTRIDSSMVYGIPKNDLGDFEEFAEAVRAYMSGD